MDTAKKELLEQNGFDVDGTMRRFLNNEALYMKCMKKFLDDTSFDQLKDAYLTVDFPQETMQSQDREYVSNMKGDTYTQTYYWAAVEYWFVTVLEVSGTAEVKEVK